MTEEQLKIVISAQTDQLKTGLNSAMSQMNNFKSSVSKSTSAMGSSFKALGGIIGKVFTAGIFLKLGKDAVNMASNLQEVQNVVDVAFGEMSYKAEEFAKVAIKQFGMSELSAKKTSSTYMAMAKSMGLGMESASNMAIEVAKLTGDVASFYNISQDLASTKLKSIFTGETETLKDLGVVMTETNLKEFALTQGITKSYNEMTQAEKVALRYNYVMNALGDAQGDFARTSDSWANQTRILSEQWKSLLGILGNGLVAVLTPLIRILNSALSVMISFAQNISNLFGVKTQTAIASTGSAVADVGGAYEEMGEQAEESGKKAKKGLMGFDEITNLQQDTGSGGTGGAGGSISSDLTEIESSISPLDEATDKLNAFSNIDLEPLRKSLERIKEAFEPLKQNIASGLKWIYDNVLVPLGVWTIEDFLPSFFNAFASALSLFNEVLNYLKPVWTFMWDNMFKPLAEWTGGVIVSVFDGIASALDSMTATLKENEGSWNKYWATLGESKELQAFKESFAKLGTAVKNAMTDIYEKYTKPIVEKIGAIFGEFYTEHLAPYIPTILDFFTQVNDFLTNVIIPAIQKFYEVIKPVIDFVIDSLGSVLNAVGDVLGGVMKALSGIIEFVTGVFTGDWDKAWEGIKKTFSGLWDGIWGIVKGAVNLIIGFINFMIKGVEKGVNAVIRMLNSLSFEVPDWVPGIGGETFGFNLHEVTFAEIPKLARGGIVDGATTFIAGEHGKEAVIPLENNTEWMDKMASKVVGMMTAVNSLSNDSVTINVPVEINGREVANATIKDLNLESIRRGYKPILNT